MKKGIISKIIVGIIAILVLGFFFLANEPPEDIKKMVEDNKEAYDFVANFYYSDFKNYNEIRLAYTFMANDTIVCCTGVHPREIILDKSAIDKFAIVGNSYYVDEKIIDRVYVYNNFVSLCNENGRESVVYSVDGTEPKWVDCPGDKAEKIDAVKIVGNWYYVVRD